MCPPGFYFLYAKLTAKNPHVDPAGLEATGFYELHEVDKRQAREDEEMGVAAQNQQDSSESEEEEVERPVKKPAAVKQFCLSQVRDAWLRVRNRQSRHGKLSMDTGIKPLRLGFVNHKGAKTIEDFSGLLWRARVGVLHDKGFFLARQFDNLREAYLWEASLNEKKKKEKKKKGKKKSVVFDGPRSIGGTSNGSGDDKSWYKPPAVTRKSK